MIEKNIAIKYWKEAISTAVHTLNWVQLKKDSFKTPYELWYGYKPNLSYLKVLEVNVTFWKNLEKANLMRKVMFFFYRIFLQK